MGQVAPSQGSACVRSLCGALSVVCLCVCVVKCVKCLCMSRVKGVWTRSTEGVDEVVVEGR